MTRQKNEVMQWISGNMETWESICKADGHSFTTGEALRVFSTMLEKGKENPDFDLITMVLLTVYRDQLPFLGDTLDGEAHPKEDSHL